MDVISIPLLIITLHPIGGRGNQTRDDQTTIKNDGTADETGIRMPAVISLDQVSMIMVIRRGRIGLVGNGHREGWRRDVDLQLIEKQSTFMGVSSENQHPYLLKSGYPLKAGHRYTTMVSCL